MDYRVISIGTLSRHELWQEKTNLRTAHSTCTLIRSDKKVILVDPGLPSQIMQARLAERADLTPDAVTDVFLTNFRPAHRHGLSLFDQANWYLSETERESVGQYLIEQLQRVCDHDPESNAKALLQQEIQCLQRCQAAPDQLAPGVDLFPAHGFTPGTTGLLLAMPSHTVVLAGDAIPTEEHLQQGRVLRGCYDVEKAKESLMDIVEIADVIIPGHDNLQINRTRRSF